MYGLLLASLPCPCVVSQTTTVNMLTCSFAPSGGQAVVNGADTQLNAQRVRLSTGLCPQHDTLWEGTALPEGALLVVCAQYSVLYCVYVTF